MVQKIGLVLLAFVTLVAIGGLIVTFRDPSTGLYTYSGGGRWYYGPLRAQMEPAEACIYSGLEPVYPQQVYTNEWGTLLSVCQQGSQMVGVPLTQTVLVR